MKKQKLRGQTVNPIRCVGTAGVGLIAVVTPAFATTTNTYAANAASWVLDGVFWLIVALGIIGAGMSAVKRNITAAVGILLGAAIICTLCKYPSALQTIGTTLKGIIGF